MPTQVKRKPGRPPGRKPIASPRSTQETYAAQAVAEPLTVQVETLPDGTTRLPNVVRLTEYASELLRIADKLRIFDAQTRRNAIQGLPRNFLLRAQNVTAYIYDQVDSVPDYPARIL